MVELKTEYIDLKGITHKIQHSIKTANNDTNESREQITEKLFLSLTRTNKLTSANHSV